MRLLTGQKQKVFLSQSRAYLSLTECVGEVVGEIGRLLGCLQLMDYGGMVNPGLLVRTEQRT